MKPTLSTVLTTALLTASLAAPAQLTAATAPDPAQQQLARDGAIQVRTAGPHVQRGTFRVQVARMLGRPDAVLGDGTWLYEGRRVEGTDTRGTLVVRFNSGRVSELALATPAVVAALRTDPRQPLPSAFVAAR